MSSITSFTPQVPSFLLLTHSNQYIGLRLFMFIDSNYVGEKMSWKPDAMWRTSQAVGYSECIITSILNEKQQDGECTSTDTTEETTMTPTNDINSQTKEIIARVYHQMKIEAEIENVRNLTNAKSPSRRTAQAVGYSQRTVFKILKEERQACANTSFVEPDTKSRFKPPSKRKRVCPKSTLDNYDLSLLRKTIISYQTKNHEMPTLKELKEIVSEKNWFQWL
ncbi:uncharacterized protein LOC133529118 isoform X1 [Cydia pomonella]|uniref:uncharacterized protein LOC133529118 isoform X1 n=1 Tax=Cydia pomonella TaxID=82600 RepID=UPI002ADE01B8|nr:uncharacterized protein LOC133529118 isoform X1 [Cydia pomonella]